MLIGSLTLVDPGITAAQLLNDQRSVGKDLRAITVRNDFLSVEVPAHSRLRVATGSAVEPHCAHRVEVLGLSDNLSADLLQI